MVCLRWTIGNDSFRGGQEVRRGQQVTVVADMLIALQAHYCHEFNRLTAMVPYMEPLFF